MLNMFGKTCVLGKPRVRELLGEQHSVLRSGCWCQTNVGHFSGKPVKHLRPFTPIAAQDREA